MTNLEMNTLTSLSAQGVRCLFCYFTIISEAPPPRHHRLLLRFALKFVRALPRHPPRPLPASQIVELKLVQRRPAPNECTTIACGTIRAARWIPATLPSVVTGVGLLSVEYPKGTTRHIATPATRRRSE